MDLPPKEEEARLLRFLDNLDGEAEAAKREVSRGWQESMRQIRGDQWRNANRDPYFLANITKNVFRRKVSILTETKPQFQIAAIRPGLSKSAAVIYNAIRAIFDRNSTDDAIYRACFFAPVTGAGFLTASYDPIEDEIIVSDIDPRRVFIDPMVAAASDLDSAHYIRVDSVVALSDIRARFPGRGMLVKPDTSLSSYKESQRNRGGVVSAVLAAMPRPYKPAEAGRAGPIPRAELREYWIKDPQLNTEGTALFVGGRHIIRAGNIILVDEPNPYWDGSWPIVMFEWDIDYDRPWGQPEVPDLWRLQEAINRLGDAWVKNTLVGSNFKIIADADALEQDEWEKLDNEAGLIIRKRPTRSLEYQSPVSIGAEVPQSIQALIQLCDLLVGNLSTDPRPPQGPGSNLEGLQHARQTLIRSTARRFESALERLGQKLISRVFQFMTSDKVLFQQGASRAWVTYTFERQKLLQDDEGRLRSAEDRQKFYRDYKFLVTPYSSLALTRVQRLMAALQLRSATGIAPSLRRILQEADLGDPDDVIKEGLEEMKHLPPPPPPKGRSGRGGNP